MSIWIHSSQQTDTQRFTVYNSDAPRNAAETLPAINLGLIPSTLDQRRRLTHAMRCQRFCVCYCSSGREVIDALEGGPSQSGPGVPYFLLLRRKIFWGAPVLLDSGICSGRMQQIRHIEPMKIRNHTFGSMLNFYCIVVVEI